MPRPLLHALFCVFALAVLLAGWWFAGDEGSRPAGRAELNALEARARTEGPVDAAFCGPLAPPREPPPLESPFGIHLYASSPRGIVTPLAVMEIAGMLPAPEGAVSGDGANKKFVNLSSGGGALPVNETAYDDVATVLTLLEEFRRAFGAMPTGELNDEIVRRLQGENAKGIAVMPKSHPSLNSNGELLDRWGTPYRFHPESAWEMTVRSAGPDKKMWTNDDILSNTEPSPTETTQL
ncbi:MAG TPA: hypothetical protein VGE39_17250 [Prosthecobacter sp.]